MAKNKRTARMTIAESEAALEQAQRAERERDELRAQLNEALEQQTATSEILRVISGSPTDLQPVFDTIVKSAARLCDGMFASLHRFDGELLYWVAQHNFTAEGLDAMRSRYPMRAGRDTASGRAVIDRTVIHIRDFETDPEMPATSREIARAFGYRSLITVPMLRKGQPVGAIAVARRDGPFSAGQIALLQTFADQAVIAIENVRLFTELQASNRELTTALDTQTATADILRVISRSQTDVQPVFEAIADSAMRLFGAWSAAVWRYDSEYLVVAAARGGRPGSSEAMMGRWQPRRPADAPFTGRTVSSRSVQQIIDAETDPMLEPVIRESARERGWRTTVQVPMLRGDDVVGVIGVTRAQPGGFSPAEIALLQTFADQAIIAIENVRLFTELQDKNRALTAAHAQVTEALERETATSEILRVISSSPTDVQPVFQAVIENAVRLCGSVFGRVFRREGQSISLAAHQNFPDEAGDFPRPLDDDETLGGRAARTGRLIRTADVETDPSIPATGLAAFRARRVRSVLVVPISHQGATLGSIVVGHADIGAFSDAHVALLQTFADQAVIAIENVRLFNELQERNRAVTEALDQQTATASILQVISSSPTDVQPVFDAIAKSALRLLHGWSITVSRVDDDRFRVVAVQGGPPGSEAAVRDSIARLPRVPGILLWDAISERRARQITDVEAEDVLPATRESARLRGWRANLAVPMMQEGRPIGVISVTRVEPGAFSAREVQLLQTFADQAVIAIENVRLFTELQERTSDLARSVDQLTALGEVSRAVSSTLDLHRVLDTVVSRASQLARADGCSIYEYDEQVEGFRLRATSQISAELIDAQRATVLKIGEGAVGRLMETRAPVQIPNIADERSYRGPLRDVLITGGFRALLAVPMIQEDRVVGGLVVSRRSPGEFPPETVDLLLTFANQSALAIENARLFREI